MNTIGERIKILRKSKELSQVEFAEAIGISQGTLSDIENDRCKPSIDTIISIHNALDCSALNRHIESCFFSVSRSIS